jgi:cobalt-zinc-cadmium efflux system membrane fusion protein
VSLESYVKGQSGHASRLDHIRILRRDPQRPSSVIEVLAPVSGTIVEQNVTAAAGVKSLDNSPNLFTIADLSQVWVICDVYENDLAQVRGRSRADRIECLSERKFGGRDYQYWKAAGSRDAQRQSADRVIQRTRFAAAQYVCDGSFPIAGLAMRTVVPANAVLRLQDRDWVFVKPTETSSGGKCMPGGQQ